MENIKNRIYNYETPPPDGVWDAIANQLDDNEVKVIPLSKKNSRPLYYLVAASAAIILFVIIFFTNHSSKPVEKEFASIGESSYSNNDDSLSAKNDRVIITIPTEDKNVAVNKKSGKISAKNSTANSDVNQKVKTGNAKKADSLEKLIVQNTTPAYITIEGPQGKPVKVSYKMATLIDSTDESTSSKPVWNKKISEWREIMKANSLAPTTGNFLDIIELTKSLKDHK